MLYSETEQPNMFLEAWSSYCALLCFSLWRSVGNGGA